MPGRKCLFRILIEPTQYSEVRAIFLRKKSTIRDALWAISGWKKSRNHLRQGKKKNFRTWADESFSHALRIAAKWENAGGKPNRFGGSRASGVRV